MAFKFVAFTTLLAAASAGLIPAGYHHSAPAHSAATDVSYSSVSHAAPTQGHLFYGASPAIHTYSAPAVHAFAAPVVAKYAATPLVAKYAAPVYAKTLVAEPTAPANYDFEYSVHDPITGDVKQQKEERHGDAVHGSYSFVEADGSKRIVEYTADEHNGFNAVVHREEPAHSVAYKAAPVAYATAPVVSKYAAPLYHH